MAITITIEARDVWDLRDKLRDLLNDTAVVSGSIGSAYFVGQSGEHEVNQQESVNHG